MTGYINSELLFELKKDGNQTVLEWCMNVGLIASAYKCHRCGRRMRLIESKESSDGFEWHCKTYGVNGHDVKRPIRKGSFFSESKLTFIETLLVTYYWINNLNNEYIIKDLRLNRESVVDWRNFCREVCMEICVNESSVLGGMDVTVEIHQCKVGNRKINKRNSDMGTWVLGGLEKGTNKLFFSIVNNINKEMLLDIIKTYILPGTTIVSDCWKAYACLDDEEFKEFALSQNLLLKDPEDVASNTNKSEVAWGIVEHQLSRNYCTDRFDSYLAEVMWRRSHNNEETMEGFLDALLKVCPPRKED